MELVSEVFITYAVTGAVLVAKRGSGVLRARSSSRGRSAAGLRLVERTIDILVGLIRPNEVREKLHA